MTGSGRIETNAGVSESMQGGKGGDRGEDSRTQFETANGFKKEVGSVIGIGPYLIPAVAVAGAFGIGITAMILRNQSMARQHRERMFLAEKGMEIPRELYEIRDDGKRKSNGFKAGRAWLMLLGTLLIFIGIGVMIALGVSEGMDRGVNGIIPMLIGVGFLTAERMIAKVIVKPDKDG
jgi:uncharacterized membrane protein SpoIIM required for sporulation